MIAPEILIKALNETDEYVECIFMQGSCYQFAKFLKLIYPEGIIHIKDNKCHVAIKIGDRLYDITGAIPKSEECLYDPIDDFEEIEAEKWSFRKNNMLWLTECDHCGEKLIYDENYFKTLNK